MYRIFVAVSVFLCAVVSYAQPAGYTFGKHITILSSQVAGASPHSDFPVLISFTDPNLRTTANGGNVRHANGYDIIFTSDCLTQLDHQIEYYNATTGKYVAWVRIPSLSNSVDTHIYMYYGNASVSLNPSVTSVWETNYKAVYHYSNNSFANATSVGGSATNSGSTNNTNSKIGEGRSMAASGEYIQTPTTSWSVTAGTISLWANVTAFGAGHQYFFGHTVPPGYTNRMQLYTDDTGGNLDLGLGNSHTAATNIATLTAGQWYYIVLTWNGTNYNVYVNGTLRTTGAYAGFGTFHTSADIGDHGDVNPRNEAQNGTLDEFRASTVVRPLAWITTEYNNQNNPGTFYTVSAQMTAAQICALPIELKSFRLNAIDNAVKIMWTTATETNNDHFTIERSTDGLQWKTIAKVKGAGSKSTETHYTELDKAPLKGRSYYRLKQTDYNGDFTFSKIESIHFEYSSRLIVYPNPARDELHIEYHSENPTVSLFNSIGQDVLIEIEKKGNQIVINTSDLPKGIYILKVFQKDYGLSTMKIQIE